MPDLFIVWSDGSVALAIIAGLALGFASGSLAPGASHSTSIWRIVLRTVGGAALVGFVFYVGQATVSDDNALRVVSRFLLWLVYSFALGAGIGGRVWMDRRRRRRRLAARALVEVAKVASDVEESHMQ